MTGTGRLVGIDLARGVALITMMAAHILPPTLQDDTGTTVPHPGHLIVDGRSAALFAVLAGLSLTLVSGRDTLPPPAALLTRHRTRGGVPIVLPGPLTRSVWARAVMIAVIGLTLGLIAQTIAVILVNYALLFVLAPAFLRLRAGVLTALAAAWVLVAPVLSFGVRHLLWPNGTWPGPVTSWIGLASPVQTTVELLLIGYYPVLTWTGYLLTGLAVGRSGLLRTPLRAAAVLIPIGAGLALLSATVSSILLRRPGVVERLVIPSDAPYADLPLSIVLHSSMYGTTPTTSWWWLVVNAPHSGTPVDLVHTIGTSLAVIGCCLAVAAVAAALIRPLAWAGAMTLTLYTLHVVVETVRTVVDAVSNGTDWAVQVIVLLGLATIYRLAARLLHASGRGPLEAMVAVVATAAAGTQDHPGHPF